MDCIRLKKDVQEPGRYHSNLAAISVAIACLLFPGVGLAQPDNAAQPVRTMFVDFKQGGVSKKSIGEVVVRAADGGMLFQTPDGHLWTLQPEDIVSSEESSQKMSPISGDEIYLQAQQELPAGFLLHKTTHYVIVYNTSETYARWVGELFERLFRGFNNYWKNLGIRLSEPRFPLVAYVFDTKPNYLAFAKRELGDTAESMIGYYHLQTNRVVTFDLTGVEGFTTTGSRPKTSLLINKVLAQPQAERTVATIVHEAVHQLAYNSGLQVRLADNPFWVSEGLAMFFETPDVSSSKGWGTIGKVNRYNLMQFRKYLSQRPADSLTSIITTDERFRKLDTATAAYAEGWALTYFLLKTKRSEYASYLKELSGFEALGECTARERVAMFQKFFGEDLVKFDQQFVNYMRKVQ